MKKDLFEKKFKKFIPILTEGIQDSDGNWTIKGFTDVLGNVYPIANDTKIISKLLENQIFPLLKEWCEDNGFDLELPKHQNYYPDATLISKKDKKVMYAVDFKTTYRDSAKPEKCNGFTLGSHGTYFHDRTCTKNIQYPYSDYMAHYSLGLIYDRNDVDIDETKRYNSENQDEIQSVISNFTIFLQEKWKIASDKRGSGNTANIGSVKDIQALIEGKGTFAEYGEKCLMHIGYNMEKPQS